MKVLVDTSVWSLALRRRTTPPDHPAVPRLIELIEQFKATLVGPVRQELLSGIRNPDQYDHIRDRLRAFPDLPIRTADYELAADFFNQCRAKGIQGSNTDFLICATAARRRLPIFTTDHDFESYRDVLPIQLY